MRPFLLLLLLSISGPFVAAQPYVGWSTAYYPGWNQAAFPPASIDWKGVTHISHFALTAGPGGSLIIGANGLNDAYCKAAVAEAHRHGKKILICIGGQGAGTGLKIACAPGNIHKFVKNLLDFMRKYGYDGIDTDWEDGFDDTQFLAWHKELRDSLDRISPRPLLTLAGGGYFAKHCAPAWPYVDQMNDMSYDIKYNHLAVSLKQFTDLGVPPSLIGVGIGIGNDLGENNGQMVDGTPVDWDGKVAWAADQRLGGIMQWELKKSALVDACFLRLERYLPAEAQAAAIETAIIPHPTLVIRANPATGRSEISYSVGNPAGAFVDLALFDGKGVLMQRIQGYMDAGPHALPLIAPCGRYSVRLIADGETSTATTSITR
jgi:chitinase